MGSKPGAMDHHSLMPYGRHKGKPMGDVPAQYLIHIYHKHLKMNPGLKTYIHDNLEKLHEQAPWDG